VRAMGVNQPVVDLITHFVLSSGDVINSTTVAEFFRDLVSGNNCNS